MKMFLMAMIAGSLWLATSGFGQAAPQAAEKPQAKVTCPCGRECDGACKGGRCGRGMGAGRMQGSGRGRMMMGHGFRGGMRGGGPAAPQTESTPKK